MENKKRKQRKNKIELKTIMKRKRKRRILSSCDLRVVNVCVMHNDVV